MQTWQPTYIHSFPKALGKQAPQLCSTHDEFRKKAAKTGLYYLVRKAPIHSFYLMQINHLANHHRGKPRCPCILSSTRNSACCILNYLSDNYTFSMHISRIVNRDTHWKSNTKDIMRHDGVTRVGVRSSKRASNVEETVAANQSTHACIFSSRMCKKRSQFGDIAKWNLCWRRRSEGCKSQVVNQGEHSSSLPLVLL